MLNSSWLILWCSRAPETGREDPGRFPETGRFWKMYRDSDIDHLHADYECGGHDDVMDYVSKD